MNLWTLTFAIALGTALGEVLSELFYLLMARFKEKQITNQIDRLRKALDVEDAFAWDQEDELIETYKVAKTASDKPAINKVTKKKAPSKKK